MYCWRLVTCDHDSSCVGDIHDTWQYIILFVWILNLVAIVIEIYDTLLQHMNSPII